MVNRFKIRLNTLRFQPAWLIFLIDVFFSFFSALLVYLFLKQINGLNFKIDFFSSLSKFLVVGAISAYATKSYQGVIRHTSFDDLLVLTKSASMQTLSLFLIELADYFLLENKQSGVLYYYCLSSFFCLFLLFNYRMGVRYLFFFAKSSSSKAIKTGIFGAGESGVLLMNVLRSDKMNPAAVLMFFDDDITKCNKFINGIPVLDAKRIGAQARKYRLEQIIVSPRLISNKRKEELFEATKKAGLQLKIIPQEDRWFTDKKQPENLHNVEILDLLGREQISADNASISRMIQGKTILITGAAGSIGSELARQIILEKPDILIVLDQAESPLHELTLDLKKLDEHVRLVTILTDVVNERRVEAIFKSYKIDIVFHAAAYKHVPMQEQHPYEAVYCNVMGTYNLANLSMRYEISKFIMVSTDKAVNPTNIMGATKRAAEVYIQALNKSNGGNNHTQFITTRFGNVLGSNGSVVPLFKKQIQAGGPLTLTHPEITRYFMTISEACNLVLEAGSMGKGGEIFVFDMGTPVKIKDLAEKMIQLSGKEVGTDIKIEYTGLRQGEKLYEELLANGENTQPTYNKKIMIAKVREYDYNEVITSLDNIFSHMNAMDELNMVAGLKKLIPEFISHHSRFCSLDEETLDYVSDTTGR